MRELSLLSIVGLLFGVSLFTACASDDEGQQTNPSAAAAGGFGGVGGVAGVQAGGQGGTVSGGVGGVGGQGGAAGVMIGGQGGVAGTTMVGGQGGAAGGGADGCEDCQDAGATPDPDAGAIDPELCKAVDLPDDVRAAYDLDAFYTRTALAHGVPIISSDSPADEALTRACLLIVDYASASAEVQQTLLDEKIYFIMMGADEKTVDTPEFRSLGDLDWRARGLGGVPAAICAEENVLCDTSADRWRGESICVHEYAHTMHLGVYDVAIDGFSDRLEAAYDDAMDMGLYANTYAASQPAEYFAEGVQNWYNTNLETRSGNPDGVHNHINTRDEMRQYDPQLYDLIADVLPAQPMYRDCYYYE